MKLCTHVLKRAYIYVFLFKFFFGHQFFYHHAVHELPKTHNHTNMYSPKPPKRRFCFTRKKCHEFRYNFLPIFLLFEIFVRINWKQTVQNSLILLLSKEIFFRLRWVILQPREPSYFVNASFFQTNRTATDCCGGTNYSQLRPFSLYFCPIL